MKKLVCVVFMALLAFANFAIAASPVSPTTPESRTALSIVPIRHDPYPAEPGRYLRLWIKVENPTSMTEQDARFRLDAGYPFFLDPTDSGERAIGIIESGRQFVLEYKLRVDALAMTGDYNNSLWLRQCHDSSCNLSYVKFPIKVFVRRSNPIIDIVSVVSSPSELTVGSRFALNVGLRNSGSRVKDVVVSLNLSSAPFSPFEGSIERRLEAIDGGQNTSVRSDLIVMSTAIAGVYKVPITISYYDEVGNYFTKIDTITLIVGGRPDIYIGPEDTSILRRNSVADFVVNIVNKGLVDVKFLSLKLLSGDLYYSLSPTDIYIGKLESDDYETAKFKVFVGNASGQADFSFYVTYMDALNNEYRETRHVAYNVLSDEEAARFGLYKPDGTWMYLVAVGLVIIYLAYRRIAKRKR